MVHVRIPTIGEIRAFGRFAGDRGAGEVKAAPRHAMNWRDKGPHESSGAAARRLRQMARRDQKAGA